MINIINRKKSDPYKRFYFEHELAKDANQASIEAIVISSYDTEKKSVDSRFVNLKFIDGEKFIFFSNYSSPKSNQFAQHSQISSLIYWNSTNTQIRLKAIIKKTNIEFNKSYFKNRSVEKNALAISSNQSNRIETFQKVEQQYNMARENEDLKNCPDYWGGYYFIPYEIEFWKGNKFRLNKRESYKKSATSWQYSILEP